VDGGSLVAEPPVIFDDAEDRPDSEVEQFDPEPDRPRRPNWPRVIGNIGRTLIFAGVLILLFVAYQLWGTAIHEARSQKSLRTEFATVVSDEIELTPTDDLVESLDAADVVSADNHITALTPDGLAAGELGTTQISDDAAIKYIGATLDGPPPPPPEDSDAIARIRIPRIGVDKIVVEGVTVGALKKGPGHYPGTPLPGQPGNSAIAGHRTTYGSPFWDFDKLAENDLIYVTTQQGEFVYRIAEKLVVDPSDVWVLDASADSRLTLTTCNPKFSARERLVIVAELIGDPAAAGVTEVAAPQQAVTLPSEETPDDSPTTVPDDATGGTPATTTAVADTLSLPEEIVQTDRYGLDGEGEAATPAVLAGLIAAVVWIFFWVLGKAWRKWPSYLIGVPFFLLALFIFFEMFAKLLPANI
jgi:sortase A